MEIRLEQPPINFELLDEEMRAALPDAFVSMDVGAEILVRLKDDAPKDAQQIIEGVLQAHDPKALSAAETKRTAQQSALERFQALDIDALNAQVKAGDNPLLNVILVALQDVQTALKGAS